MKRAAAAPWLVAIVGASFLVRMFSGWLQATPALMPDEYIYASIGRSLAESGRPLIRGGAAHFPALLQPILTAPAWLVGDVGVAYRLAQAIGALVMSLAAVPVYLLARHLGLSTRLSLALAALAALVPDLVYAGFISSEAVAYPLVLTAVYAAVRAVARPTSRAQVGFVAAAALATLARVQFAVLPVVFALAVVAVGSRERRLKAALREQALPLGLFALTAAALGIVGSSRTVGIYGWLLGFHAHPIGVLHWAVLDAMVLAYAAGWIIVPGGLLGLGLAVGRPRSRPELAFGAVAALLGIALLLEAGFLQDSVPLAREIQERYVFYAIPLLGVCFALYASRGWPLRLPHLALAAGLVIVSVRVPLSGFAVASTVDASPILYGVYWLTRELDDGAAPAALIVAAFVALLSVLSVAGSRRPRLGTPLALALALFATAVASAGAVAFDMRNSSSTKHAYLPADPSYVDRTGLKQVALLQSWGGRRVPSMQQLFWNRSVTRVLLLPGAGPIDAFGDDRVRIAGDGSLRVGGQPFRGPLLVDGYASTVRLRGARIVARGPVSALWAPAGEARLALYAIGRYHDGWLADVGAVYLWPSFAGARLAGEVVLRVRMPDTQGRPLVLHFEDRAKHVTSIHLGPGARRTIRIPVCSSGRTHVTFRSSLRGFAELRAVSVRSSAPVFVPDDDACPVTLTPVGPSDLGTPL